MRAVSIAAPLVLLLSVTSSVAALGDKTDNSVHNQDTKTDTHSVDVHADTNASNTKNTQNAGNQDMQGNNGGGNYNGATRNGGVSCRRALQQARRSLHEAYAARAWPGVDGAAIAAKAQAAAQGAKTTTTTNTNTNNYNQQSWDNHSTNNSGNSYIDNSTSQNLSNTGGGTMNGSGSACRREVSEFEMERRHIAMGHEMIAYVGGLAARSTPAWDAVAARDLGALADDLGVRAVVPEYDAESGGFQRRSAMDLACTTDHCSDHMKREAEEMLFEHARSLGYVW